MLRPYTCLDAAQLYDVAADFDPELFQQQLAHSAAGHARYGLARARAPEDLARPRAGTTNAGPALGEPPAGPSPVAAAAAQRRMPQAPSQPPAAPTRASPRALR